MQIAYREATIADSPEIARLAGQLGYPADVGTISSRLSKLLTANDHIVYVSDMNDRLAGWIHAHERFYISVPACIEIAGLVVDQDQRGNRIGTTLMQYCEDWANARGFREIRLRSGGMRAEAHSFYLHIGYENIKMQQAFRKQLQGNEPHEALTID
ncbi:GCN5-related N-acetyltransferase [Paenibacillus terrae HPL-003]|uniref:GCN5-related N-acetyltransferase n=1 Tax=Paenibacillus terrae (strain HPL-003) TaxID=985665 RepID=G7VPR6_PAETH|nr:GNAT family N-acetyltransferase [Paenibacillus terrae]AET61064.1 GCN5-related N-acetyltransferase [Paenibacillus terrae HPL-003]